MISFYYVRGEIYNLLYIDFINWLLEIKICF